MSSGMHAWQMIELALLLVPGFLVLWRVRLVEPDGGEGRPRPPRPGAAGRLRSRGSRMGAFSVVIPARDEEERLPLLLRSIEGQTVRPREVIVVNDASRDGTRRVAREAGCRVIDAGRRPSGWLGKTWACWVGAREARSPLLLFLDADTRLEPGACERLLQEQAVRGGVVTAQPWHRPGRLVETLSALFNVVVMAAINSFTILQDRLPPAGCFGPCILCRRGDYFRAGGHREVRRSILEDLDLGQRFLAAGVPVHCRGGRGTVQFRMYPGGRGMIEGWTKNMARGAQGTHPAVLALITLWITGCASAAGLAARWIASGSLLAAAEASGFYLAYAAQLYWMLRRAGGFGAHSALLFPVHLAFFAGVFARSALLTFVLRRVSWRGRRIRNPGRIRNPLRVPNRGGSRLRSAPNTK